MQWDCKQTLEELRGMRQDRILGKKISSMGTEFCGMGTEFRSTGIEFCHREHFRLRGMK